MLFFYKKALVQQQCLFVGPLNLETWLKVSVYVGQYLSAKSTNKNRLFFLIYLRLAFKSE